MLQPCVNRVILLGQMSKHGVEVRVTEKGTCHATCALVLSETGQDGHTYTTLVDCECWGKSAEKAGECAAGQVVLFEGKLRRHKRGEHWETTVSGFDLVPISRPSTREA